jgi:uncharacterized membrane protein
MIKAFDLRDEELPDEFQRLPFHAGVLFAVIQRWGEAFDVPVDDIARWLNRFAVGYDQIQAMAKREQSPSAAAERLLQDVQRDAAGGRT